VISVSACGSLKEELPPGHFVLADQFIDRTHARDKSFLAALRRPRIARSSGLPAAGRRAPGSGASGEHQLQARGTYLAMEGPQFSTLAESKLYRSWGCDVIGMTAMPEAKLAREAELLMRLSPW